MKPSEIPSSELEFLATSEGLAAIFEELERDTFEELMRLPIWASRKRQNALIQRVSVIRDVQHRIRSLKAIRSAGQKAKA
jgi:hypothetical protein